MTDTHGTGRDDHEQDGGAPLHAILDDLAHLVESAKAIPMSSSVRLHREDALALVDELRAALPEQLAHADEVLAEADRVLQDARRQAEDVVTTARARAIELVQAEQVVVQAESRAREIVDEARERAAELRRDADDYCDRRLSDFETDLGGVLAQVRAGRAKLADRLDGTQPASAVFPPVRDQEPQQER